MERGVRKSVFSFVRLVTLYVCMCVCMCVCVCVINFFFKLELPQGSKFWCTTCTYPLDAGNFVSASPLQV